ncbi:hypothetical protein GWK47_023557 [Chionoecetes opilio]|uniref:Apple domain-containing protein n=1 Tax=Chionoecetes opilio TaxID=41210 RepID=A0A8J5CD16_CHIOP|nr:hypothetical protein GWK47_023557 [Chionoecetes opilio]
MRRRSGNRRRTEGEQKENRRRTEEEVGGDEKEKWEQKENRRRRGGGQCRGTETFEKVSRATLEGVQEAPPLYTYSGGTVTCRESRTCSGFVLDYKREACFSQSPVYPPAGPKAHPRPADYPVNYFQKICLSGPACGKAWLFERVVGFEIEGYDDLVLNDVVSRLKCAELCLGERNLSCRSAEYHESDRVCRLSRQDRRTQPLSFRPSSPSVHYMENQCAGSLEEVRKELDRYKEESSKSHESEGGSHPSVVHRQPAFTYLHCLPHPPQDTR